MGSRLKSHQPLAERCISDAASHAAEGDPKEEQSIKEFLLTGEDDRAQIPERDFLQWMRNARAEKDRRVAALHHLFGLLAKHLPAEAKGVASITPDLVGKRVRPMVEGLVQADWRMVALQELGNRVFVLNHATTPAAMAAEISTSWIHEAWRVLWLYFADYGLAPKGIRLGIDGVSAGTFAHVRPSAQTNDDDPYCDVVVHEAAHLLHYLKPGNFQLRVRRGQERFVDVDFACRELFAYVCEAYSQTLKTGGGKEQIEFAGRMLRDGASFPKGGREQISDLLVAAAKSRNGWNVIREAVVTPPAKKSLAAALRAIPGRPPA